MTISYSGNLAKTLFRWRGSLWQAVWKELLVFLTLYFLVKITYLFVIIEHFPEHRVKATKVMVTFDHYTKYIPLTFLLGFYVACVVARWWQQFNHVAWPDSILSMVCFAIPGTDEDSKLYRHRIGRYLCLTCALAWRDISKQELTMFKQSFLRLYCYDWVCLPLAYTQVTACATYGYFAFCVVGRQFVSKEDVDFIFPVFTCLQFLFYVGWFKVAQVLMRPFGTDDDDIELTYLLNRHVQSVFATLEHTMDVDPPHEKDEFWGKPLVSVGHTKLSAKIKEHPPKLHAKVHIRKPEDEEIVEVDGGIENYLFKQGRMQKKAPNLRPF